jgi:hypothetical protein
MPLGTQGSRSDPEHVLPLDPFNERFRYFVIVLGHVYSAVSLGASAVIARRSFDLYLYLCMLVSKSYRSLEPKYESAAN